MIALNPRARVLVVDDDPGILRAVSRILAQHYDVTTAAGGAEALRAVETFSPDLAVLDVRMPEINGFDLMRRLHAVVPDIDVILMTGDAEEPDAHLVQAIDAGAFYFIQKPFERQVLLALAGRCLELRRLREENRRSLQRMEDELAAAQQFQQSMLPPEQARLRGVSIDARYVACTELAGDFYDYIEVGDDGVAVLIADVVGHGTAAAMMTSIVKSAFHSAYPDGFEPVRVIERIQDGIRAFDAGRFITLCCARIDPARGRLVYASAGHPSAILRRANGRTELLESTGPLISSACLDMPCNGAELDLRAGDTLLLYTDGVTEARGPEGQFNEDRLVAVLEGRSETGAPLLDAILTAVERHAAGRRLQDDITMLVARIDGGSEP
jgi:phosphoserine phosphatase RsbU/P